MDDFKTRADALYESCRSRWRNKLQKGLPKNVELDIAPGDILPFSRQEFYKWLWALTGLNAFPCVYCRTPIDILNLSLDHRTPLRRGGGPELENLGVLCVSCNSVKGEFTEDEFLLIVAFVDGPGAHIRARLEGVMKNGNMATMMRFFPRKKGEKKSPKMKQTGLSFELREF